MNGKIMRGSLMFLCIMALLSGWMSPACAVGEPSSLAVRLENLEKSSGGRLGVALLNVRSGALASYRGDERFPVTSTFKVILAAAVLKQSETDRALLEKIIRYSSHELVVW